MRISVRASEAAADGQQPGDVVAGRPSAGRQPGAGRQGGRGPHQVAGRPPAGGPREPHRPEQTCAGSHEQGAQGDRRATPPG